MKHKSDLKADLALVEQHLSGGQAVWHAWGRVSRAATAAGSPPSQLEQATNGAAKIADHLHKMAEAAITPLPDTQGMEELLFRWVVAAEGMTALLRELIGDDGATAAGERDGWLWTETPPVDEAYQPDYCDRCGTALHPTAGCLWCGWQL